MALEPEIHKDKTRSVIISTTKWARTATSLSVGFIVGLSIFLVINASFTTSFPPASSPSSLLKTSSESTAEPVVDAVVLCKAGVIKYTPLGAYPGGSDQVKAALNYCNNLG